MDDSVGRPFSSRNHTAKAGKREKMMKSFEDPYAKNLTPKPKQSGSPELKLSNMNAAIMDPLKGSSVISFRSNESNRSERRSTHTSPQIKNVSLNRIIEIEDADGIVPFN